MRICGVFAVLPAMLLAPCGASAGIPDGDVFLEVVNSRITTGLISEDGMTITHGPRVFFGALGLDIPNVGNDPGFQGPPGTFPLGISIGIDIRAALRKWNGADFSLIPPETMTVALTADPPIETPLTDMLVHGPSIGVAGEPGSEGEWHHHPFYTLTGSASDGIYLIQMDLYSSDPTIQTSLPLWIVWSQNDTEENGIAAVHWAQDNLVPAPHSGMIAAAGALGLGRRRRRG